MQSSIHKILRSIAKRYEFEIPLLLAIASFCIFYQETSLLPICGQYTSKFLFLLKLSISLNIGLLSWFIILYLKHRFIRHSSGFLFNRKGLPFCPVCRKQLIYDKKQHGFFCLKCKPGVILLNTEQFMNIYTKICGK